MDSLKNWGIQSPSPNCPLLSASRALGTNLLMIEFHTVAQVGLQLVAIHLSAAIIGKKLYTWTEIVLLFGLGL